MKGEQVSQENGGLCLFLDPAGKATGAEGPASGCRISELPAATPGTQAKPAGPGPRGSTAPTGTRPSRAYTGSEEAVAIRRNRLLLGGTPSHTPPTYSSSSGHAAWGHTRAAE